MYCGNSSSLGNSSPQQSPRFFIVLWESQQFGQQFTTAVSTLLHCTVGIEEVWATVHHSSLHTSSLYCGNPSCLGNSPPQQSPHCFYPVQPMHAYAVQYSSTHAEVPTLSCRRRRFLYPCLQDKKTTLLIHCGNYNSHHKTYRSHSSKLQPIHTNHCLPLTPKHSSILCLIVPVCLILCLISSHCMLCLYACLLIVCLNGCWNE